MRDAEAAADRAALADARRIHNHAVFDALIEVRGALVAFVRAERVIDGFSHELQRALGSS